MKRFKNKALAAAILLCMMFSLLATPIMAAENAATTTEYDYIYNEDGTLKDIVNSEGKPEETYPEEGYPNEQAQYITVTSEDMIIQKGEMGDCYYMDVYGYGAAASSFCMEIEIPYFIQVMEVRFSDRLNSAENAVSSTSKFGESVMIAYSSAENFENDLLFTLVFTMRHNLVEEEYGNLYAYGTQFVNADAELVDFNIELGRICVTANGEAPADIMMGDADLNGFVELADVMYIIQAMVSYRDFTELSFMAADIDRNGTIDMMDCQYIQNYLVGRLESLENVAGGGGYNPPVPEICTHEKMHEEPWIEPSCENPGLTEYRCVWCNYSYMELIPAHDHPFYDGICENCGLSQEEYEKRLEEGCDHSKRYDFYSEDATCREEGLIIWFCPDCQDTYQEMIPRVPHEFNNGYCIYCNEYEGGNVDGECAHPNMYDITVREPVCGKAGIVEHRCDDCGFAQKDKIPAPAHEFYDGYCMNCGMSQEEYEGGVVTPPADGCNHEKKYERYSENATCYKEGIIDWYCEDCGYEYKETLPMVPHEFTNGYCMYCKMSEEEYNGGAEGEIGFLTSYKDETIYFELYSDDTFVGTVCQCDINMDGKLDECDRNEIRGNWKLSEDQSVLFLNDEISGQTFTFKVTAEGEIYR